VQHLQRPDGNVVAYARTAGRMPTVVFLGGFRSDMTGTKAMALEAWAHATGHAYLRFDYLGHGQSSGRFEDGTIGRWRDDSLEAIDRLTEGKLVLVGSSMGAWIAVRAALARPERVAGLVTIAAAPDFTEDLIWARLDETSRRLLSEQGRIERPSNYSDQPDVLTLRLIEEARRHLILRAPITISCPVRLLHGSGDKDVPWQCSLALFTRLQSGNRRLSLLKGGDHRLSEPAQIETMLGTVAELLG